MPSSSVSHVRSATETETVTCSALPTELYGTQREVGTAPAHIRARGAVDISHSHGNHLFGLNVYAVVMHMYYVRICKFVTGKKLYYWQKVTYMYVSVNLLLVKSCIII